MLVLTLVAHAQHSELEPTPLAPSTDHNAQFSAPEANTWQELAAAGVFAIKSGALDKAYEFQRRAMELVTPPRQGDIRPAQTLVLLSEIHASAGKSSLAEAALTDAVAAAEKAVGSSDPAILEILDSQANFYYYRGQLDKALPVYQRILNITESAPDRSPRDVANRARNLAGIHEELGRPAEAEPLYRRALAAGEKAGPVFRSELIQDMLTVATFYRAQKNFSEAESLAQKSIKMAEETTGANSMDTAFGLASLAETRLAAGKPRDAEPLATRALAIAEELTDPNSADLAPRLVLVAKIFAAQQKPDMAEAHFERALALTKTHLGADTPEMVALLDEYADVLDAMGNTAEAQSRRQQAHEIANPTVHEPTLAE
jgi:tetratricopeptide (TPR) repeat protein